MVTAGGLLFIGATDHDHKFHAFDKATGTLLWETTLPVGGNATPATYEINRRQFVVIAAGGGKSGRSSGGSYVAFALPQDEKSSR
jgi:quinoprotein glucose dehydrogenase